MTAYSSSFFASQLSSWAMLATTCVPWGKPAARAFAQATSFSTRTGIKRPFGRARVGSLEQVVGAGARIRCELGVLPELGEGEVPSRAREQDLLRVGLAHSQRE